MVFYYVIFLFIMHVLISFLFLLQVITNQFGCMLKRKRRIRYILLRCFHVWILCLFDEKKIKICFNVTFIYQFGDSDTLDKFLLCIVESKSVHEYKSHVLF